MSIMRAALATVVMAHEPTEPWGARVGGDGPELELGFELVPLTARELDEVFRGGEAQADLYERRLVWAARAHGAIDVRIAEGLHALTKGDRLLDLCFHLDDYAREVLDIGEAAARNLARLGGQLRARPLLREAMEAGRVQLRAAQTIARVAIGDDEAAWVERAASDTVRALEHAVRAACVDPEDEDEPWFRLRTQLPPDEREVVDLALKCAGRVLPGSKPLAQWEAMAQEWLGSFSTDAGENDERRPLGGAFRLLGPGESERRAALEAETERWSLLPPIPGQPAPDVRYDESDTADVIDRKLRRLAKLQKKVDDVLGYCAHVIRRTRIHRYFGFTSFRHYVTERLQLSPRAVEQRADLEARLWESPALREAKRQGVSYERLRALATLPEAEIGPWTPRAHALTCIELRRRVEGEKERQMRSANRLGVSLPRRVAVLLAAAVQIV
ncbi:MAG TPA: HNH endonuclease, partial [Anaeromyxobacteraceae bacterium]|nr:HNH endonuclease [Anaeromyxobacteraceae bacterium]